MASLGRMIYALTFTFFKKKKKRKEKYFSSYLLVKSTFMVSVQLWPCAVLWTANNSNKIINVLFWREAAGNQGVFVLPMTVSPPSETLKHASLAEGFLKRTNDPRARHCRLFNLTIVVPSQPPLTNLKNKSLITVKRCESAQECPEQAGNKDF